ncbi:hypothetical protein DBQ68_06995 [Lactobacillus sp. DS15_6]|uniref:Uncharacterized protein n=1 Tax=Lacticaseibacillus paracasei subsp. paracasei Lpp123 TaxID=1256201 RepID=A0A829GI87_LACPA|nr:hypothetical protein A3778_13040 [Lacticaseibacillus paracasei]AUC01404.1 hypothetical protein BBD24_10740 [Lacticaseibacillus paracasei subsp. paracasei]EPC56338.1 hypothetical protein Lpp123_05178 [Lacticaseibacillus paracasei subsp. paracasei Lpp123]EPC87369.1 hypothetical protein Lpp43_06079 [Lacticaseibacillus paracasei subsp. paracasei Lpp43]EPD08632.1 hypothetical protein Lpp70_03668 [Lacticaseibacillus paracasei subsp. paracasei Lpp70]PTS50626.1 hypothetical protein DBQ62_06680 [Lac
MAGLWPFMSEVLMCRFLGLRARFGKQPESVVQFGCITAAMIIHPPTFQKNAKKQRSKFLQVNLDLLS